MAYEERRLTMKNRCLALLGIGLLATASLHAALSRAEETPPPIEKKIRKAVLGSVWYGVFDIVTFDVKGSEVFLNGAVMMPVTKQDIIKRITRIPEVTKVTDQIEVLPVSSMDNAIRRMLHRKLYVTADMYRYLMGPFPGIHIIVKRGHVSLEGIVSSEADRRMALMASRGIPGVFSLTNNLLVAH
jgi:hyperosmotically inducible protein